MLRVQTSGFDNRFDIFESLACLFFKFVRYSAVGTLGPLPRNVDVVARPPDLVLDLL